MRELTAYEIEEVNGGFYQAISNCLTTWWTVYQIQKAVYSGGSGSGSEGGDSASASTSGGSATASVPTGSGCVATATIGADGTQTSVVYCP